MACNCKKVARAAQKHTEEETMIKAKGINKIISFLGKLILGFLLFLVLIIIVPIIVVYSLISVITGKSININKVLKIFTYGKRK